MLLFGKVGYSSSSSDQVCLMRNPLQEGGLRLYHFAELKEGEIETPPRTLEGLESYGKVG